MEEMEEDVRKILEAHERRLAKLEALMAGESKSPAKRLSGKEFIFTKEPKDEVQKVLALAYYLEKHEGLLALNSKDLEQAFREAKEAVPDNINYKVIRNIKKGHMMEAKEKKDNLKAWGITASGERLVESNFDARSIK